MKQIVVILFILCLHLSASSQPTRQELAQIRVNKEGNFKYWNKDSKVITRLKSFVRRVTDKKSSDYVPVKDRIALFDVDGTLFCETAPYYFNWTFCFHRYLHDSTYQADEADRKLMQEIEAYVNKNHSAKEEYSMKVQELQAKAFRGMTQEEFYEYVRNYLDQKPVAGFTNLNWGCALYWPMIEAVSYLVANDFVVYLCSGLDRDICRVLAKDIYDIPPYHMMTSDVNYVLQGQKEWKERKSMENYDYTPGERVERGDYMTLCTNANKIVKIRRELGTKPILSWGNSSGDFPMFHYTNLNNSLPHISFCVLCDDLEREFGNLKKADACRRACEEYGWIPVSMKNDWNTIYGNDVKILR